MKYFYLYIFLLICFIFIVSYFNTYKESFNSDKQKLILLGDSILKNDSYVSHGESLHFILSERTNKKTYCYAVDDSKIINVYNQINEIPSHLNTMRTTIFLSIGGNDILQKYVENPDNKYNNDDLLLIFSTYTDLVKSIQNSFPIANIVLLDIYYPHSIKYKQYHSIISDWNNLVYNYAGESSNNITSVFRISNILTQDEDFILDIEPSSVGSKKVADIILSSY
jgi:hypothetical protein